MPVNSTARNAHGRNPQLEMKLCSRGHRGRRGDSKAEEGGRDRDGHGGEIRGRKHGGHLVRAAETVVGSGIEPDRQTKKGGGNAQGGVNKEQKGQEI